LWRKINKPLGFVIGYEIISSFLGSGFRSRLRLTRRVVIVVVCGGGGVFFLTGSLD